MTTAKPILLALLASACIGLGLVGTQFGLRHVTAADGALVSIPAATALFWVLSPFHLDLGGWQLHAAAIFALVGLFFPAAVTLLTFEANQRMGPAVAGAVGGTTPLFAAAAAVLFLGRTPDALDVSGHTRGCRRHRDAELAAENVRPVAGAAAAAPPDRRRVARAGSGRDESRAGAGRVPSRRA